jgi:hypothetical protein
MFARCIECGQLVSSAQLWPFPSLPSLLGIGISSAPERLICDACVRRLTAEAEAECKALEAELDAMIAKECADEATEAEAADTVQAGTVVDELPGCEAEPTNGATYCAMAYLVYLENGGHEVVPAGQATLCEAHHEALEATLRASYPGIGSTSIYLRVLSYINAAEAQAARVSARTSGR